MSTVEVLGKGTYGKVLKELRNGKYYAVKEIISKNIDSINGFLPEVDILTRIDHPNVMKIIEFEPRKDGFNIVMEIATPLDKLLSKFDLPKKHRLSFIHNIGSGIDFVMKSGYAHCDIKNDNILVIDGIAKLADFGLVTSLDPKSRGEYRDKELCETSIYRAPEHYYNISFTIKEVTEIWSYGYVVLSLIYNTPNIIKSFLEKKNYKDYKVTLKNLMNIYKSNKNDPLMAINKAYGDNYPKYFIPIMYEVSQLQNYDPSKRTRDLGNFLRHPFFKENNIMYNSKLGSINIPNNEILSQLPSGELIINHFNKLSKWLAEVCLTNNLPIQVMCLSLEIVRRIQHRYTIPRSEFQMFGSACLFLAEKVLGGSKLTVNELEYLSNRSFTRNSLKNKILEIMKNEKGAFTYETIYDIAKNKKAFFASLEYLIEGDQYYLEDFRTSARIARKMVEFYPPTPGEPSVYISSDDYDIYGDGGINIYHDLMDLFYEESDVEKEKEKEEEREEESLYGYDPDIYDTEEYQEFILNPNEEYQDSPLAEFYQDYD